MLLTLGSKLYDAIFIRKGLMECKTMLLSKISYLEKYVLVSLYKMERQNKNNQLLGNSMDYCVSKLNKRIPQNMVFFKVRIHMIPVGFQIRKGESAFLINGSCRAP